jgi:hypothetical protein
MIKPMAAANSITMRPLCGRQAQDSADRPVRPIIGVSLGKEKAAARGPVA